MINFDTILNVYFLGIGGIGMSALARFSKAIGKQVAGYDLVETELTKKLVLEGITVHYTDDNNQIPAWFIPENTLVVVTPAVPTSLGEYRYLAAKGFRLIKRSELLGLITQKNNCIAVAGTHGKTSVSTMIAHLLYNSDVNVGAFLGGISKNFNSNMLLPPSSDSIIVTEADEFDRSFLQLSPSISVITSIDPDHLDIYGDFENLKEAFGKFICRTLPDGKVLYNSRVNIIQYIPCDVVTYSYSLNNSDTDFYASNIRIKDNNFLFDFYAPHMIIHDIRMGYPGRVNLENMVAAIAASMLAGVDPIKIQKAIVSYHGVARRFDVKFESPEVLYIDDYAHHPREIEATILSVKELYPDKKITGVFQPHLYSRTRDFADGFAKSLDLLDETILLDIYPAREQKIEGVDSDMIFRKMESNSKKQCSTDQLISVLENSHFDILMTLGAGNIDKMVEPIVQMLNKKYNKQ